MSVHLLTATLAFVRSAFTAQEVATVQPYGGEFNSVEMDQLSYSCPAILITSLGFEDKPSGGRISGKNTVEVRMAAFVAAKHAKRELRMDAAMNLAERLSLLLRPWVPTDEVLPVNLGPLEPGLRCENLFSRAIDAKGQALWLVSWTQCVQPKPGVGLAELGDLLRVEIIDTTHPGTLPAPPTPGPATLIVTEEVNFHSV